MMKNILLQYMNDRIGHSLEDDDSSNNASLITISREYGCSARVIAEKIIALIEKYKGNKFSMKDQWLIINKGIIKNTANELNLDPKFIKEVTNSENKGIFEELIMSFSDEYIPSDIRIKDTIANVIRKSSKEGNRIIIGRSGASILKDSKNSLHIRLEASERFRIERLMKLHSLTEKDAKKRVKKTDKNRKHIRNYFKRKGTTSKNENCTFDVVYNCERFSKDEIAKNIFSMMVMKKMI